MLNFWSKKTMMGNAKIKPITFSAAASMQQWKVPAGVRKIHVDCAASQGMNGGKGGRVRLRAESQRLPRAENSG